MNLRTSTTLSALTILLSSCASFSKISTESYYGKNGKKNQVTTCSMYKESNCNRNAGNICKSKGYKVVSKVKPAMTTSIRFVFQCK